MQPFKIFNPLKITHLLLGILVQILSGMGGFVNYAIPYVLASIMGVGGVPVVSQPPI